ncbi:hypothetical protein FHU14_001627 [Mesorhizobium sp. RMAD-H1]|nr:hypothetical protein [Mesorhizobium sp. RMAD-H1]
MRRPDLRFERKNRIAKREPGSYAAPGSARAFAVRSSFT